MPTTTLNIDLIDYYQKVQNGDIAGSVIFESIGERYDGATTVTGEDIWRGNDLIVAGATSIPIPPDLGEDISITFESANDTLAGTGAQMLGLHYLDPAGDEQTLSIEANGGTVNTGIEARFIQELHVTQAGSNGVAVGNIVVHKTGDNTATGIYSMIYLGGNQSLVINKMIPRGKTFFMKGWQCGEARGKRATVRIRSTDREGVLNDRVFLFKGTQNLNKNTSGEKPLYSVHPEFSIIKISSWNDQNDSECSASFWGVLIDN